MKKIDLGQTISILANLGVLAGIVFLAIEVSQNQATLEEQTRLNALSGREAASESFNNIRTLLLENPDLMQIWNKGNAGDELTAIEEDRFELLCATNLFSRLSIYTRQRALDLDAEVRGTIGGIRLDVQNSNRFRECWDEFKEIAAFQGHEDFVELVETGYQTSD